MSNIKVHSLAIVGATGLVGRTFIEVLAELDIKIDNLYLLASCNSQGTMVVYKNKQYTVINTDVFDFTKVKVAVFFVNAKLAQKFVPIALASGCWVIDNSSAYRQQTDVPLIVPEINSEILINLGNRRLIANPNCAVIQLLTAIKPLHDVARLQKITLSTYQSVSGSGKAAINELYTQTRNSLANQELLPEVYAHPIAFNVLAQIDEASDSGYTLEELKIIQECQKILALPLLDVRPTCVRVPVFYGHSEAVQLDFAQELTALQAKQLLAANSAIEVIDDLSANQYPTPRINTVNSNKVYVGRLRNSLFSTKSLDLWIVSNNLRKGAAWNAWQILEILLQQHLYYN